MTVYQPFRISYHENGKLVQIPSRNRKSCVAAARPLRLKNIPVDGEYFDKDVEEWTDDMEMQTLINALPTREAVSRQTSGSQEAWIALNRLASICQVLAPIAKKRSLTSDQEHDLLEAMEEVDRELNLTPDSRITSEEESYA